ncbi:olfactory receptor 42 [Bombyx mori]|uniref:Odorant receptor n=1 Tax=Bombyx mori TaxID=7091 RepID=Q0EEF7_BOMMO|nr:olfactory receptor 42 [Bombyx mori]BAF31193.1 candidate olfactory receptor [Bombyx mori]BAH66338.1 olfactory receptor [Bombyx mori]
MDIPKFEELLKQIKMNFWLMGIPFDNPKIQIRYYVLLLPLSLMLIEEIAFFGSRMSSENFLELTQLAPCICIGVLSVLKILALTAKRQKIYELTQNLECLHKIILNDTRKTELVRKNLVLIKFITKYFFVLNAVLIFVYNFSSPVIIAYNYIVSNEVQFVLPYAVLLPFKTDSWIPWLIVYVYSIFCGFTCVLYYATVDVLYCVMTSLVCNNFSLISFKLQKVNRNTAHLLKEVVKEQQYVLKLAEDLENIFTAPNLFNVLIGSVEICALGFNLMIGDLTQIPGCILFLSSVLLQILIMSVFGENLISESSRIAEAAFLCKWYEMDQKSKKTILTIMIRSHKPKKLTAYKFSVISYGSFSKIISTSWSYFTILRTMYTPPGTKFQDDL